MNVVDARLRTAGGALRKKVIVLAAPVRKKDRAAQAADPDRSEQVGHRARAGRLSLEGRWSVGHALLEVVRFGLCFIGLRLLGRRLFR